MLRQEHNTRKPPRLVHLFDVDASVDRFSDLGVTSQGQRMIAVAGNGSDPAKGAVISGRTQSGDHSGWVLIRSDSGARLKLDLAIDTEDEGHFRVEYEGALGGGALTEMGADTPPTTFETYFAPQFESDSPKYDWVNRVVSIGYADLQLVNGRVAFRFYSVE